MAKDSKKGSREALPEPLSGEANNAFEAMFQEVIRRGASLGFSSFFLTEEAIRRAFSDRVPAEWADYLSQQGEGVRSELIERLSREFGAWLQTLDPVELAGRFLAEREVSLRIDVKPRTSSTTEDAASSEGLRIIKKD